MGEDTAKGKKDPRIWLGLALILFVFVALRWPLINVPFDRDEGGYAYGAQTIMRGGATYADFHTMRYPAIFGAYAAMMTVFGETYRGVHTGLLWMNTATALLLFLLGRRIGGTWGGLGAATAYGILSLASDTESYSANSEQFCVFFAALGLWLLHRWLDPGPGITQSETRYAGLIGAGAALGLAYLMKQHGVIFAVFGVAAAMGTGWRSQGPQWHSMLHAICVGMGVVLPVALSWLHIAATGRLDEFLYWTVKYARGYTSSRSLLDGWAVLIHRVPGVVWPVFPVYLLAFLGAWRAVRRDKFSGFFCVGLLAVSLAGVAIGLYFRPHYFRLAFPAISLLAGMGVAAIVAVAPRERHLTAGALILFAGTVFTLWLERDVIFQLGPAEVSRKVNGANPFPESLVISDYLRDHIAPEERMLILGSEPQIYFYANRPAATPHMYMYSLTENHPEALSMQHQVAADAEAAQPRYIVWVESPSSWLYHEGAPTFIFDWARNYLKAHYSQVGLVDIIYEKTGPAPDDVRIETFYYWDNDAHGVGARSPYHVRIYRRLTEIRSPQ